jgi:hypothetical protein
VDLEKRRVIDLLPDRCAKQVAEWLSQHSTVELVSRDRFGLYSQAAVQGAPQAQQIADRFHLLMNLKEAVEKELSRQRDTLVVSPLMLGRKATVDAATLVQVNSGSRSERSALEQEIMHDRRRARQIQFEQIHCLYRSGKNVTVIAKDVGIGRKRVDKWHRLSVRNLGCTKPEEEPNPGPGTYTFRVMAANPDGVWNESGATIGFSIAPLFMKRFGSACYAPVNALPPHGKAKAELTKASDLRIARSQWAEARSSTCARLR